MINCPTCGSPNIVSNKLDEKHFERATQIGQALQYFRNERISALAGGYTVLLKVVDTCRNDYACTDCPRKFSDKDVGVTRHA